MTDLLNLDPDTTLAAVSNTEISTWSEPKRDEFTPPREAPVP